MLETLSVRPRICDQIRSGPLGRWVDDFVDVLMTRGYATGTVRACRRMSSATLPRCTCSRPASTWRPSRCGSATSDSKPPINTSRRTCNSRKTLCENSSRSVNERSGSRPTPRCWPSWRASDYDKQTTCWTPTATVSPTVTCHNAMLVILTDMTSWSYLSVPRARQHQGDDRFGRADAAAGRCCRGRGEGVRHCQHAPAERRAGATARGELVKVVGFALQAAAAETERVAAKVEEGQTTH